MSTLRQSVKRRRVWIIAIAVLALAGAAIADWMGPPRSQRSARLYEAAVVGPYRQVIRPVIAPYVRCRYLPSCSQYSVEAMRTYGFPRGAWLTAKRLCRCGPWVRFGVFDPVPLPPRPPVHA